MTKVTITKKDVICGLCYLKILSPSYNKIASYSALATSAFFSALSTCEMMCNKSFFYITVAQTDVNSLAFFSRSRSNMKYVGRTSSIKIPLHITDHLTIELKASNRTW